MPRPKRWKPTRRPVIRVKTDPPEYRLWLKLQDRDIPDRWRGVGGFANFVQDMGGYGTRPRGTVLARVDHTGPFSPKNCYWKPRKRKTNDCA